MSFNGSPTAGMRVFYDEPGDEHSAVLISGEGLSAGYCRSKWGMGPLMLHKCVCGIEDCPYQTSNLKVYVATPHPLRQYFNNLLKE